MYLHLTFAFTLLNTIYVSADWVSHVSHCDGVVAFMVLTGLLTIEDLLGIIYYDLSKEQ